MSKKVQILLVEDTPSDIRLTEEALKRSSLEYELDTVNDGVEAMEYLHGVDHAKMPDIILLDLNMPRKNGHEVLEEIKQDSRLSSIPVIVLTVSQRDEDVMEALRTKMNFYLPKPIEGKKLADLINAIHSLETEDGQGARKNNEQQFIRMVLAGNPHSSVMVLSKLAEDECENVRARVASNPVTPKSLLANLTKDDSPEVRLSVSENENAGEDLLARLAKDECDDVRLALAGNKRVPLAILEILAEDDNVYVVEEANKTLSIARVK